MNILSTFREMEAGKKKQLPYIIISYFFVLLTYTMIRSITGRIFLVELGAADRPIGWILAIFLLSAVIALMNWLQKRVSIQSLFMYFSLATIVFLGGGYLFFDLAPKIFTYVFFTWKECYIVVLIHLIFGYNNEIFSYEEKKTLYGPIGAIGAIGGLLPTFVISKLKASPTIYKGFGEWLSGISLFKNIPFEFQEISNLLFFICLFFFLVAAILFWLTEKVQVKEKKVQPVGPIESVKGVGFYVSLIVLLIIVTQFLINIADQRFHLILDQKNLSGDDLTAFLTKVYSYFNVASLGIQVLILPWLFKVIRVSTAHYLMPLVYLIPLLFSWSGSGGMGMAAGLFILYKGLDYSVFGVAKELIYEPLSSLQRYGAKYLADMLGYRFAKGVISIVLYRIQDLGLSIMNFMMTGFIFIWLFIVVLIFRYHKKQNWSLND